MIEPVRIIKEAVARGDVDRLLLGSPEYRWRDKWSVSPEASDIGDLLRIMCDSFDNAEREVLGRDLAVAAYAVVDEYEGIMPVAYCIYVEVTHKARNGKHLGFPVEDLAARLKASIKRHEYRLFSDPSGAYYSRLPDGRLTFLRNLSDQVAAKGGPRVLRLVQA